MAEKKETNQGDLESILQSLSERAKELNCLYHVDEVLSEPETITREVGIRLVNCLPAGWQYPGVCCARIEIEGGDFVSDRFQESPWKMSADIEVREELIGRIDVYYTELRPPADEGPFLKEERRLIQAISDRIGLFVLQQHAQELHSSWELAMQTMAEGGRREWGVILGFLKRTDPGLLIRITRKMINHLCWTAVEDADALLTEYVSKGGAAAFDSGDENQPLQRKALQDFSSLTEKTFELASSHLGESEVVSCIQVWIEEEKSGFLIAALESQHSSLTDIVEAVGRFRGAEGCNER